WVHGGEGATAGGFRGPRARRMRDGLLVAEAAFAALLLVAATLLARSFIALTRVDAGYTADHVLLAEVIVPGGESANNADSPRTLIASIVERTRAIPGVVSAGATNMMPLDGSTSISGFPSPWTPPNTDRATVRSFQYIVTPGYAEAIGLRLKKGRLFADSDM